MNKRIFIVFLVLVLSIFTYPSPVVKADGASTTEEVWVEYHIKNPSGWALLLNDREITLDQLGYYRNLTTWDYDYLEIYRMRVALYTASSTGSLQLYFDVWNATSTSDASYLVGERDAGSISREGGTQYISLNFAGNEIVVYSPEIFIGIYCSGGTINNYIYERPSGYLIEDENGHSDPFYEDYTASNGLNVQLYAYGYKNFTTTFNQYFGDVSDNITRRDLNYTFQSEATQKQIRMTFPSTEEIRNITYSNGGLWDQGIPSDEYTVTSLNGTHKIVTVGNTAIDNYGGDLRVYTQSQEYVYDFSGAFFENGTNYGAVNITAHTSTGSQEVEVDGVTIWGSTSDVIYFSWSMSGGGTRRLYTPFDQETFGGVFIVEDTYATYDFEIKDYTGRAISGERFLEAYRIVNSTEELIERMIIRTGNDVPINLVTGQTYILKILWGDQTRTTWGYFVPGYDPSPTIILRGTDFSDTAYTVNQFITLDATRSPATTITVDYEDTRERTVSVNISIRVRGSSEVNTYYTASDTFTYNWAGADADLGYIVSITGEHQDLSSWGYTKILDQDVDYPDAPDLGSVFTFGGLPATTLLAYGFTLTALLTSSVAYKEQSLLFAMVVASVMSYIGWADWGFELLALGWFFTLLVVLLGRSRR